MVSFSHSSYPAQHSGDVRRGLDGTKALSALLLAAMVSALVVVADRLIDTWADGHLMVTWVALWLVGFAALAVFAGAARQLAVAGRQLSGAAMSRLDAWSERVAHAKADERLWALAQTDPRLMADLTAAMSRSER